MIDVADALRAAPKFKTFCSVEDLLALAESLRTHSAGFSIEVGGTSSSGVPIHHVRFGKGSVKALFVAFPHCDEPIGGLTVYSLLTLLSQGTRTLIDADVEWHIVPCIDPDGAMLNEGWSQKAFTLGSYMRNFHKQDPRDQVESSFPIKYKKLEFDRPIKEAKILKGLLDDIRPDFYYSLHNAYAGGAFYFLTRDIGQSYYRELYKLLQQYRLPLQVSPPHRAHCAQFAEGVYEQSTMKNYYDLLEKSTAAPQEALKTGACSWEYLAEIKDSAVTLVTELPYLKHPSDGSKRETSQNLRQLKLRMDAENKFVATVILEEWQKVEDDLDCQSPFYKKIFNSMVSEKEKLCEGLTIWPGKTRDILFNSTYDGTASEGERFNTYLFDRFYVLCNSYEFVRLLKVSSQTLAVRQAIGRLESVFDEALADMEKNVGFDQFEIVDCDALARVQLASGLVVLNSVLESKAS